MAVQTSMFKLSGKLRDEVFYSRNGKKFARAAAKNYKMSEESKKSGSEFGAASSAGALIRKGFAPLLATASDKEVINRLNSQMATIIRTGSAAEKGSRQVVDGDLALLDEFEFNRKACVHHLFKVVPEVQIDPLNYISITLPEFNVAESFRGTVNNTHAVIQIMCCEFNFDNKNGKASRADDLVIGLNDAVFGGGTLEFPVDGNGEGVLMVGIAVYFKSKIGVTMNQKYLGAKVLRAVVVKGGEIVKFQYPEKKEEVPMEAIKSKRVAWKLK